MRAYHNDIFTYKTSFVNDETVGTLTAVAGATAVSCPQGRILTENGRKLYPGANPGITSYMVGVFDHATGLSGVIDPNSSAFTPQNTDRPYYFASPGSNSVDPDPDRAPPVFTRGDLLAQGNLDLSGAAHIYGTTRIDGTTEMRSNARIYGTARIDGATEMRSNARIFGNAQIDGTTTMNSNAQINGNLDLNGNLLLQAGINVGTTTMAGGTWDGSTFKRKLVTTSAYNSNTSFVLFTLRGINNASAVYSAEPASLNSFNIVGMSENDESTVQWMILN
jgi:hypothetical protein